MPRSAWRDDYTFIGWFTEREGGEELTPDTVHYEDTTYYAHWDYTLSLDVTAIDLNNILRTLGLYT